MHVWFTHLSYTLGHLRWHKHFSVKRSPEGEPLRSFRQRHHGSPGNFMWLFVWLLYEVQTKRKPVALELRLIASTRSRDVMNWCVSGCFPKNVSLGSIYISYIIYPSWYSSDNSSKPSEENTVVKRKTLPVASADAGLRCSFQKIINIVKRCLQFSEVWPGQAVPKQTGDCRLWGQQGSLSPLAMMGQLSEAAQYYAHTSVCYF